MTVSVELMGRVGLVRDGQRVEVGGAKLQAVLSVLALSAGRRVSTDRIVDLVWDDGPPISARRSVQSYVASLRRSWGDGAPLSGKQNGYVLSVSRADVDLLAFEDEVVALLTDVSLAGEARADALAEVLARWEPPLAGLRDTAHLRELCAPFDELHLQAIEGLVAAQIDVGRAGAAVRTLEAMVREHPTRENLWFELARGLDAIGRRDQALGAVQRAREALREYLGVHPSAQLTALERALLNDPESAAIDVPAATRSNSSRLVGTLPNAVSMFVGREVELVDIGNMLMSHRLVTLSGLGGIGKTSLALTVAAEVATRFGDGCWWIDIGRVTGPALEETFLQALGVRPSLEVAPRDDLVAHLRTVEALLVIDNCEARIDETAELVEVILRTAPGIRVLTTSRRRLGVVGEAVWPVRPLGIESAVELFAGRARLVQPDFEIREANRRPVEMICRRLDGFPLAIELAAARLDVLSSEQILHHLSDRFALLAEPSGGGGDDRRTLVAALDWSYELLSGPERTLLRRLAVFVGSFPLEAVAEMSNQGTSTIGLIDSLARLVGAGLLIVEGDDTGTRYRLLQTVRDYAHSHLDPSERSDIERRHATYHLGLASRIRDEFETEPGRALRTADESLDDHRAAIAWAYDHGDPHLGLSIARKLRPYWGSRGLEREEFRWLLTGIRQADDDADVTLLAVGDALIAAIVMNDPETLEWLVALVEHGLDLDLAQRPEVRARLLSSWGAYLSDTNPRAAEDVLMKAAVLAESVDMLETLACVNNWLSLSDQTGDLRHVDAMLALVDGFGDAPPACVMRTRIELAAAALRGQWDHVISRSRDLLDIDESTQWDVLYQSDVLYLRVEAFSVLGRHDEALANLGELANLEHEYIVPANRGPSLLARAKLELRRSNAHMASSLLAGYAVAWSERDRRLAIHMPIASLAAVGIHQLGDDETAAVLFGHASSIAQELDITLRIADRPLVEAASELCRTHLGVARFDELAHRGSHTSWNELVAMLSDS